MTPPHPNVSPVLDALERAAQVVEGMLLYDDVDLSDAAHLRELREALAAESDGIEVADALAMADAALRRVRQVDAAWWAVEAQAVLSPLARLLSGGAAKEEGS